MTFDRDVHERMITLAKNLLEATKAGKISWALTDRENKFLYAGTRSSVAIELFTERFGDDDYTLSLINNRGTTIDSLTTEHYSVEDHPPIPAEWNDSLEDLYYSARRIAHNVDEAIESMLADIERGTPSPPSAKKPADDPWASGAGDGFSDEPPF